MAEILITGMDLSEDRQIIITKDGEVLATDWRGISMPTEATARQLPPHGRLCDIDRMISESRKVQYSVSIQSADELADFLEIYAELDKSPYANTVVIPSSEGE